MWTDSNPERIRWAAASLGVESLMQPEVLRNTRIAVYEAEETVMSSGDPVTSVSAPRYHANLFSIRERETGHSGHCKATSDVWGY